jgi:hypothetical protein
MHRMSDAEFARAMQSPKVAQDKMFQEARLKRDGRLAKKQAEREELQKLQNEEEKEAFKHQQRQAWIANGGDNKTFEEVWPQTWLSELKRRVGENASEVSTRQYLHSKISYDI